jgi:EAL domain-containing protein (putative c-di-GMP-specific phosphodiesterase class I)
VAHRVAEESGLILEISRWVFTQALECFRHWDREGRAHLDHVAINVGSRQFSSPTFVSEVMRDLVAISVPAHHVVLEVTEGTVIENFEATARKMEQLREIGIRFSVDDFGVGYSSLSDLSRLPLDQLKIDRSFVTNALEDPNDRIIAETIIGMGRNLNLQTIAEGVESAAQLEFLRSLGCDGFQGFLLSRPVPECDFVVLDKTCTLPVRDTSS